MPTKGTSQLNKKLSSTFPLYPVNFQQFEELEALLGIAIPDTERDRIQEAARLYLMYCKVFQDKVLWRDSKAALEEIVKRGEPFLNIFEGVDSTTVDMLISVGQQSQNRRTQRLLVDEHEKTVANIRALIQAAQNVLDKRKGKRGGKKDRTPVRQFCYELKLIYESITGEKATSTAAHSELNNPPSLFVRFADSCLKVILTEKGYRQDALNPRVVSDCVREIIKK
jgi:hypothetical protein